MISKLRIKTSYIIEGKTQKNQEIILEVINYDDKAVLEDIVKK